METLKNYIIETNIFLTEAKLPEFINKYMKFHANHPLVKENPEQARELIAGAHKHANDHDEAMFLTQNLLNGMYKPEEDDLTMSNVVRTWRSAKAKGYLGKEEKLQGLGHDDVAAMFKRIPELANAKMGMGSKQRSALRALEPYKIGTINHPKHGKLGVYNFNPQNSADDTEREKVRGHFKNLCSGTHYSWCVLASPNYMQRYSQNGPGFFTYVNEDGVSVISHGHGDRATPNNPGGVVVDPGNETHAYQEEVKRQTYELLPRERQIEYGLSNNVMNDEEKKLAVKDLHSIYKKEDRIKDLLKLPDSALQHATPDIKNDIYDSFKKGLEKDKYIPFDTHRDLIKSENLVGHFADKILSNPEPDKNDLHILRHLHFNSAYDPNVKDKEFQFVNHPNVSVRRAFASSKIPYDYASSKRGEMNDASFEALLKDPDPGVRHNIITSENMRGGRAKKFIFESDAPEEDRIKALFSAGIAGYGFGAPDKNPLKHDSDEHLVNPKNESFFTKAIHIDGNSIDQYGAERVFDTINLKKIYGAYRNQPSSEIMEAIVSHPNTDPEHYREIMASTASKDVKIAGFNNKNADASIVNAHIADPNPEVRIAALTSPKSDIEHFHKALYSETDPDIRRILSNKFSEALSRINDRETFKPAESYVYGRKKNTLTEQHKRNRDYALSSGDEDLLKPVYDVMAGDQAREDVVGEHLIAPSILKKHMETDWDNRYLKGSIKSYWRNRKEDYIKSQQHFNSEEEKNNFIEEMDKLDAATPKPQKLSIKDIQKIEENTRKKVNPKKQLNEVALNQIMKYFREL